MEHSKKKPIVDADGYFIGWGYFDAEGNKIGEEYKEGKSEQDRDSVVLRRRGSVIRPKEPRKQRKTRVHSGIGDDVRWID